MLLTITLIGFSSCGNPMALMMSGGGLVISQNSYSKLYNGLDAIMVITTDKNIKTKVKMDRRTQTLIPRFYSPRIVSTENY